MKIYTVGPVSGVENWEKSFEMAKEYYESEGYIVLSPLDYPSGLTQKEYMMLSVQNVFIADMVVALPGWEKSKGATAEISLAASIGTRHCQISKFVETETGMEVE